MDVYGLCSALFSLKKQARSYEYTAGKDAELFRETQKPESVQLVR